MNRLRLTVNGAPVAREVEARMSLADFLREELHLTGTHLGCEQGVCGACTVNIDGVPARTCIGSAFACNGAEVRTIESYDDDPLMIELRRAFNAHHALQCGFCTPGMLIMARDIVARLGDADEARIRIELAGNLCRCTGYSGIVKAIRSVIVARREGGAAAHPHVPETLGPAGSGHEAADEITTAPPAEPVRQTTPDAPRRKARAPARIDADTPGIGQSFVIDHPPETIWRQFGDVPAMVRCIPGATLVGEAGGRTFQIDMRIKMGPVGAQFAGEASHERDDSNMTGAIHGEGRDRRSASLARGELAYALFPEKDGAATRVELEVKYALSGALGQFSRAGIVRHFIAAITSRFADNLKRSLSPQGLDAAHDGGNGEGDELRLADSFLPALKSWASELRKKLFRRRR